MWPLTQMYIEKYLIFIKCTKTIKSTMKPSMCEHVTASIRNMHRSVLKESWFEKKK